MYILFATYLIIINILLSILVWYLAQFEVTGNPAHFSVDNDRDYSYNLKF